jgi:AraC family transcriptional regulator
MSGAGAGSECRSGAGPPLATWHAGTGDHAVIQPHFRGTSVAFGSFRCEPGDVRWTLENQVGEVPHIIFPVTPWHVAVGGGEPELVTRNHVVFFNAEEAFDRKDFGGDGDSNHFMVLAPDVAEEMLHEVPSTGGRPRFPRAVARLSPLTFLAERLARRRLVAGAEPLEAEERLLSLAADTVRAAFGTWPGRARRAPRFVEDAKVLLTGDVAGHLTLPELGRALNVSAFHLARTFRAHTGYTLHGYRLHLRVRMAADLVADGATDLREVATKVGFSSHSHLTTAFHNLFGIPPSTIRDAPLLAGSCSLSTVPGHDPSAPE